MNTDYTKILNNTQYQAVTYCDGASVIVAGAGSGKTRVLTYKVAYLIENGFAAYSILALTFTNKAAREMRERIQKIVGEKLAGYIPMGTFHSIFLRILQRETNALNFKPNITIYDTSDSKSLIRSIIKEKQLDEKIYTVSSVMNRISRAKNSLITPKKYADTEYAKEDYHRGQGEFSKIYAEYCSRCKEQNAMDFDDILLYTFLLFKNNAEILEKYQNRFSYILVDEYQDTNVAQHQIINLLAAKHKKICVVGDDAQSIYSFRGAKIDNMLYFQNIYENCRIFKLEENYRSTQTIVNAANSLIAKNRHQIHKKVFSNHQIGDKIKVLCCFTDFEEARIVANEIEDAVNQGVELSEIAVLYRTNAQSRVIEEQFVKRRLPYKIYGGHSFYARKEIKDALAYMRLIINSLDEESLKRIINYPVRGIGDVTLQKLLNTAHSTHISAMEIIFKINEIAIDLNSGTKAKLKKFGDLIAYLTIVNEQNNAYHTAEKILIDSGIFAEFVNKEIAENRERSENLEELLNAIHEFCEQKKLFGEENISLADFLSEVSLMTDQDSEKEQDKQKITLMTIHAAKGLEFKNVYILGLEEELFPSSMCVSEIEIEEERRLFYVAITRAKNCCSISYAKNRFRHGQSLMPAPSRFLQDIDEDFLEMPKVFNPQNNVFNDNFSIEKNDVFEQKNSFRFKPKTENFFKPKPTIEMPSSNFKPIRYTSSSSKTASCKFNVGEKVKHNTFGIGTVTEILDNNEKLKISFEKFGVKTLLLKYAQLERV